MNIAICLTGMHYNNDLNRNVDYRLSLENYKSYMISPLTDLGHNVDILLLTYNTPVINNLRKDYNTIDNEELILDNSIKYQGDSWERTIFFYTNVNDIIKKQENNKKNNYNIIIVTRFDHYFPNKKITEFPINWTKINMPYKHGPPTNKNCACEIVIIPRQYLDSYHYSALILYQNKRITHELNHHINDEHIHYWFPWTILETYQYFPKMICPPF
jgi:hypothetical protein